MTTEGEEHTDAGPVPPRARPPFEIEVADFGGYVTVAVVGCLEMSNAEALRVSIAEVIEAGARHVIVDLNDAGFGDATGLGVLVAGRSGLRRRQGELRIVCGCPEVRRLFEISGLATVLTVHDSLDGACLATTGAGPLGDAGPIVPNHS